MQIQTETKLTETQTKTTGIVLFETIDTTTVAIHKPTDTATIAIHQAGNRTETTQTNNDVHIVTEQITNPENVKLVLTAEDWDLNLANVDHHDKIRTIDNKTRILTKTTRAREIKIRTATKIPHSNEFFLNKTSVRPRVNS